MTSTSAFFSSTLRPQARSTGEQSRLKGSIRTRAPRAGRARLTTRADFTTEPEHEPEDASAKSIPDSSGKPTPASATLSALDALLGTSENEAAKEAAAAAEAEAKAAEARRDAAARHPDQRRAWRHAEKRLRHQQIIQRLVSRHPLPPRWMNDGGDGADFIVKEEGGAEAGAELRPGEFALPVMPVPYPIGPGELTAVNHYEPRWMTLFAKMLAREGASGRTLTSASGMTVLDLDKNASMAAYELPLGAQPAAGYAADDIRIPVVPGHGRYDEAAFVGSRAYGVVYDAGLGGDDLAAEPGTLAAVGTLVQVLATDLQYTTGGKVPVLMVIGRATARFKVQRVLQTEPYPIVAAVLVDDPPPADSADAAGVSDPAVAAALSAVLQRALQREDDEAALGRRMAGLGPEVVEEGDVASLMAEARAIGGLGLAAMLLRTRPHAAQVLLQTPCAADREEQILKGIGFSNSPLRVALTGLAYAPAVLALAYVLQAYVTNASEF